MKSPFITNVSMTVKNKINSNMVQLRRVRIFLNSTNMKDNKHNDVESRSVVKDSIDLDR